MSFRQMRIQFKRSTAMKLGLLQPRASGINFKVTSRAHQGKGGMRQGKSRISSDRIGQVPRGFVQHRRITGRTEPVTPYEFRISHRVLAISRAELQRRWTQRPVQRDGDLFRNLVLEV